LRTRTRRSCFDRTRFGSRFGSIVGLPRFNGSGFDHRRALLWSLNLLDAARSFLGLNGGSHVLVTRGDNGRRACRSFATPAAPATSSSPAAHGKLRARTAVTNLCFAVVVGRLIVLTFA
jgi:hypothetical protein